MTQITKRNASVKAGFFVLDILRMSQYYLLIPTRYQTSETNIMKTVTITQIKKEVISKGGEYKKCKFYLNGNDAYEVNGRVMTKKEMIERYELGEL